MSLWDKLYRNLKISHKIFMNYFILLGVTIVVLSAIVISVSTKAIEESTDNNTLQMVKQVNSSIELYIKNYEEIIYYLASNSDTLRFLQSDNSEEPMDILELQLYEDQNPSIIGIMVASMDNRYVSRTLERISRDPLSNEDWFKNAVEHVGTLQLISNPVGRNIRVKEAFVTGKQVVSLSKAVVDATGRPIGVILIDIDSGVFEEIIQDTIIGKTGFVFLQDEKGDIVYTKRNDIVYHIRPEIITNGKNGETIQIKENKFKVMWYNSQLTKWRVVGVFSLKEALEPVAKIQMLILVVTLAVVMFSFIASFYQSKTITKPIAKLKNLMEKVEDGDLDLRFTSMYHDEVGQLGKSFNNMLDSMKALIDLVYQEQMKKREAELEIFRAQIKPHFLYNTLDTIHWLIKENKNDDAIKVIKALTRLFRISLSKGKEYIRIDEELKHVESYLTIQQVRYEDKLEFAIHCNEKIKNLRITKLILQPIVENAIYHGIKQSEEKGMIHINIRIEDEIILATVHDNGKGIEEDEVIRINKVLTHEIPRENEYGLVNVNEKLKLAFGNHYGVTIDSVLNKGTTVVLRHPII